MSETNAFEPAALVSESRDAIAPSQWSTMPAWCVWMGANLGVLALFASRVPLAAKMPAPIEDGALIAVSVSAMVIACCLAPLLLATWRSAIIAIASLAPILVLAALLSGDRAGAAIQPIALGAAWLLAMTSMFQRRYPLAMAMVSAPLLVVGVGAPILWYFAVEFADRAPDSFAWLACISPTQGILATVLHEQSSERRSAADGLGLAWRFTLPVLIVIIERGCALVAPRLSRQKNSPR